MSGKNSKRVKANRMNSKRSTGPRSERGKSVSSMNALKHGLRADSPALPNENPHIAAQRAHAWHAYYRPASPGAQHLVNECVRATLLSDRIDRYHGAALSEQIRGAEYAYDRRTGVDAAPAQALICPELDPAEGLKQLAKLMAGCRAMLNRWNWYLKRLDDGGDPDDLGRAELMRMMGYGPEAPSKNDPECWTLRLLIAICYEPDPAPALAALFDPAHQPDCLLSAYRPDALPDRATACRLLAARIVEHRDLWILHEERLRADLPTRVEVADQMLILKEPIAARLFLRYHAEARLSFQQAYRALISTLEYDAEHAPDPSDEPDEEPDPVKSPNEANDEEIVSEPVVPE